MANRLMTLIEQGGTGECPFMFNNLLMRSPLRYTMLERRFLYKLSESIKIRYESMGLKARENWKNLIFNITDKELAAIGGKQHVLRTYEAIRALARKEIIQLFYNKKQQLIVDYFHWIDAFRWNKDTKDYTVRVSPELYDYVVCLTKRFTVLNLHTAILLQSKYSQKFYEFCCQYSGNFRFQDPTKPNEIYKQRVVQMSIETFRYTFGLSELHDPRTNKLLAKEKYSRFKTIETKVILKAQDELYNLYQENKCDVWFDYEIADRYGRGRSGSPKTLRFYIYTRENPKSKDPVKDCPWKEGDEPLFPYETKNKSNDNRKKKVVQATYWDQLDENFQRDLILQILQKYLDEKLVEYYMSKIDNEQKKCKESYSQIMQVIYEKQQQPKFQQGTKSYKQKCLTEFVFTKNLKLYGWSIEPPQL